MFKKAEKKQVKLRLGVSGVAGSGKTYSAILLALGLGKKVAVIDTEYKSASLYSDLGDYDVCEIEQPYTIEKYLHAILEAEKQGYDVIVIDSLTHAWDGSGGLLDQKEKNIKMNPKISSYTAWRDLTPLHNKLVNAMLNSKCHIIATMRSKQEYQVTEERKVIKLGLAPIQREGMEYEFTTFLEIGVSHYATATKDRSGIFDNVNPEIITKKTAQKMLDWLNSGLPEEPQEKSMTSLNKSDDPPKTFDFEDGNTNLQYQAFKKNIEAVQNKGSLDLYLDSVKNNKSFTEIEKNDLIELLNKKIKEIK